MSHHRRGADRGRPEGGSRLKRAVSIVTSILVGAGGTLAVAAPPAIAEPGPALDVASITLVEAGDPAGGFRVRLDRQIDPATVSAGVVSVDVGTVASVTVSAVDSIDVVLTDLEAATRVDLTISTELEASDGTTFDDDRDGVPSGPDDAFDASILLADQLIGAGDLSVTDRHVVVAGGTVTVDGAHRIDGLDVTGGAVLTHTPFGQGGTGLDLEVRNDARVHTDGAIDVTSRGRGVDPDQPRSGRGGSHGGHGSHHANNGYMVVEPTYGDFRRPGDPGGPGGGTNAGGIGGGVVLLSARGRLVVDGAIAADGQSGLTANSTPSGGAVRLGAASIEGTGRISADGGDGSFSNATYGGFGGGGRVALLATDVAPGLLDMTQACGGAITTSTAFASGGAGTVYVESDGLRLLELDNCGAADAATTPISLPGEEIVEIDELVVRAGAIGEVSGLLEVPTARLVDGGRLTHPHNRIVDDEDLVGLHLRVAGLLEVDATSSIDVTGKGIAKIVGTESSMGSMWPGTAVDAAASFGGSYGGLTPGAAGLETPNAPYGDAAFPNEMGSAGSGYHPNQGAAGGGLAQITAGELRLDGSVLAHGQDGWTSYCGPSCTWRTHAGSGGGILIDAGLLRGGGAIAAGGGKGNEGPKAHGSGGRVAVSAAVWDGFDPAQISAPAGPVDGSSPTNAASGSVVTDGAGRVGWVRPVDEGHGDAALHLHGVGEHEWFAPVGSSSTVTLRPLGGGAAQVLASGVTTPKVRLDTTALADGRYLLEVEASVAGVKVGTDARELFVLNQPGLVRFDRRVVDTSGSLPGGLVLFERDVTIAEGIEVTIPADARYKFAPGVAIWKGNTTVTIEPGAVLTSWADDSVGGDTNLDGDATAPAAGDWGGFRTRSAFEPGVTEAPGSVVRYDVKHTPTDIPDGYVFEGDRVHLLSVGGRWWDNSAAETTAVTIEPGAVIKGRVGSNFYLRGEVEASGTVDDPIVITSVDDDTAGGDTRRDGDVRQPLSGELRNAELIGVGTVRNLHVRYASGSVVLGRTEVASADVPPGTGALQVSNLWVDSADPEGTGASVSLRGTSVAVDNLVLQDVRGGVQVWTNGQSSVTNATILGGRTGMSLSGSGTAEVYNSIFSGQLDRAIQATSNRVSIGHNVFWSPGLVGNGMPTNQIDSGGNLMVDPELVDPTVGLYDPLPGSPVLDAADSTRAPATDALGRPRVDSPAPNVGVPDDGGNYADIGAFEFQGEGTDLSVDLVRPSSVGNIGSVTFRINGTRFLDGTTVWLERGGDRLDTVEVARPNTGQLHATFDLSGVEAGAWDVVVDNGEEQVRKTGGVTVRNEGEPGHLDVQVSVPDTGRDWLPLPAVVTYRNVGDTDTTSALIRLSAEGARFYDPGSTALGGTQVELLATGSSARPDRIAPGESGTFSVRYLLDSGSSSEITAHWWEQTDDEPYDWEPRRNELRPDGVGATVWDLAWPKFVELVGTHHGSVAQRLTDKARQPASGGDTRVTHLLDLLAREAVGYVPMVDGRLVDAAGDPVPYRVVVLTDRVDGSTHGARTSVDGHFSFVGVPDGSYRFTAVAGVLPRTVDVTVSGTPVAMGEQRLAPAAELIGSAMLDGAPAAGRRVRVEHEGGRAVASGLVKPDGSFRIVGLVPGPYEVVLLEGEDPLAATGAMAAIAPDAVPVELAVVTGGSVSGTVTLDGSPAPGASVRLQAIDGVRGIDLETDGAGSFDSVPELLPPGRYTVSAEVDGHRRAAIVDLAQTGIVQDLSVVSGDRMAGRVTDGGGTPVEGASVRLAGDADNGGAVTTTDADGHYELRAGAGERNFFVIADGFQPHQATADTSVAGDRDVVLAPTRTLTVEVVDGQGRPLSAVPVDVHPADGRAVSGLTGADGRFVLRGTTDVEHEVLVATVIPVNVLARATVDLEGDETVRLEVPAGFLGGVVHRDGVPVPGAVVTLVGEDGVILETDTDEFGAYEVTLLDDDPFDLVVTDGSSRYRRNDLSVPVDGDLRSDVDLTSIDEVVITATGAGERTTVRLFDPDGLAPVEAALVDGSARFAVQAGDYELEVVSTGRRVHRQAVTVGDGPSQVSVVLETGAAVEGVVDLPGAQVTVVSGTAARAVFAGADGSYRIDGLPDGPADVVATATGRAPGPLVGVVLASGSTSTADLTVAAPGTARAVSGRTVDSNGTPVAGARVQALGAQGLVLDQDVSGLDGAFSLAAAPGVSALRFISGGQEVDHLVAADDDAEEVEVVVARPRATPHAFGRTVQEERSARSGSRTSGDTTVRGDVDSMFVDASRALDLADLPPPARLGPDADVLYDTRWTDFADLVGDCDEVDALFTEAAKRSRHMNDAFSAWESMADGGAIEGGASVGKITAEAGIVGLETAKFMSEILTGAAKAKGWEAGRSAVTVKGGKPSLVSGAVEEANLGASLLKGYPEEAQKIVDGKLNTLLAVMQDSSAKFMEGDWDGGMAIFNSFTVSDMNAVKDALGMFDAAGFAPAGAMTKILDVIDLYEKWSALVKASDELVSNQEPANRYLAAQDLYLKTLQDYQKTLNALQKAADNCPPTGGSGPPDDDPDDPNDPDDPDNPENPNDPDDPEGDGCPPGSSCPRPPGPPPPPPADPPGPRCTDCTDGPNPTTFQRPTDPNEIIGPSGAREDRWRTSLDGMGYVVNFENLPEATGSAIIVDVTVPIDETVDLDTVRFGAVGWGGRDGLSHLPEDPAAELTTTVIDLPGPGEVHVTIELDRDERVLHWRFEARDEVTGEYLLEGFLPPNDREVHDGEGWVQYSWAGLEELTDGQGIDAQASIVFDQEDPLATEVWTNRLDRVSPSAAVAPLPAVSNRADVPVRWSGVDEHSGVATYDVYVSANEGPWELWLAATPDTEGTFTGVDGASYRFEAVAVDHVGNVEEPTGTPEAVTRIEVDDEAPELCPARFVDVTATNPFCEAIVWVSDQLIAEGTSTPGGDVFRPTQPLSRQAMAAFLYRAAGSPAVDAEAPYFTDVAEGHVFFDEIQWMASTGRSLGWEMPDGSRQFRPTEPLSRQAMAAFLHRAAGSPEVPTEVGQLFVDVSGGHPFYDAVQWMGHSGTSTGYDDPQGARYMATAVVSRQAMAAFLFRTR